MISMMFVCFSGSKRFLFFWITREGEWIGGGIRNSLYMFCFATLVVAPRLKADVVKEETIFPRGQVWYLSSDVTKLVFVLDFTAYTAFSLPSAFSLSPM